MQKISRAHETYDIRIGGDDVDMHSMHFHDSGHILLCFGKLQIDREVRGTEGMSRAASPGRGSAINGSLI